MLYSQLYTGIRFAFFGAVTVSSVSLLTTASTSVYAETVSNIRQFDYSNTTNIKPITKSVTYPNDSISNSDLIDRATASTSKNIYYNKKPVSGSSENTTQYISAYLSTKSDNSSNAVNNEYINQSVNLQSNNIHTNTIKKWSYKSRHAIQGNQSTEHDTAIKSPVKTISKKNALNRYSASITGILRKPIEPIMPSYKKGYQAYSPQNESQFETSLTKLSNHIIKQKNDVNNSESLNKNPDNIRKSVIEQQEKLRKLYEAPTSSDNRSDLSNNSSRSSLDIDTPYKLSESLRSELNNADFLVSQDTSSLRNTAYINSLNYPDKTQDKSVSKASDTNNLNMSLNANLDADLIAKSHLTDVHNGRTDYIADINTKINTNTKIDANTDIDDVNANKITATVLPKIEQANKQKELINKLIESAYQAYPKQDAPSDSIDEIQSHPELPTELLTEQLLDKKNIDTDKVNFEEVTQETAKKTTQQNDGQDNKDLNEQSNSLLSNASSKPLSNKVARCNGQWVYPSSKKNRLKTTESSGSQGELPESVPNGWYHAVADYGYYDNKRYAELTGNVLVRQGTQLIQADKVTLDIKNRTAKAEGGVMFNNGKAEKPLNSNAGNTLSHQSENDSLGMVGVADSIQYGENINAEVNGVAFASVPMQAHGYASKLTQRSDSEYNLQDVMFTTCDPVSRKWHLESKSIDLNQKTGRGETRNTTLHVKDVPVLYLPYFNFPIDSRRMSGFLLPKVHINFKNSLLDVSIPYYFNLAPNYDATVNTRIFSNRNPMLTGEFRYLTDEFGGGRVIGSYLPNDSQYNDETRNSLYLQHDWQSKKTPNLSAELQYNYVSDADYNDDFDYLGVVDNYLNLPLSAKVNYDNDYLNAQLKVEDYQSLEATDLYGNRIEDKDRPYARLPQLTMTYRLPHSSEASELPIDSQGNKGSNTLLKALTSSKVEITGEHDSAYFKNSIEDGSSVEQSGFRMYNKLSASYPFIRPWGYIKPKLSLQHLYASYDEDSRIANNVSEQNNSQSAFVPQVSVDAVANFEKKGSPLRWLNNSNGKNNKGYQLLSPRIKYSYAPYQSQNNIPNFNTRIASINYDQLYADSWFLGHDRLQDLHAVTPGVNYRYIDEMGLTRLDASIAQQFYLDSGQVILDSSDSIERDSLFNENSSGLVASISTQPRPNLWLDFDGALKDDYNLNYITSQLRYQPTTDSQFSIGITERKQDNNTNQLPISAVTASAVFPINNNWRLISQAQYDYDENHFLDSLVGVDYEDCCVGFSVYGRRYYNDLNINDEPNQAIMAEVRLKGLSSAGSFSKLLSQKVMGIDSVNTSWKQSPDYRYNSVK